MGMSDESIISEERQAFTWTGLEWIHPFKEQVEYQLRDFHDLSQNFDNYNNGKNIGFAINLAKDDTNSALHYSVEDTSNVITVEKESRDYIISATGVKMKRNPESTEGEMPDTVTLDLYSVSPQYNFESE